MRQSVAVITGIILLVWALPARAQRSPLVPEGLYDALVNEISGDIAFEHIRWLTHYHRPMGGSEGFEAVAKYVEQKAREYGLEDVRYIPLKYDSKSWSAHLGELWIVEPYQRRLAFSPETALSLADYSRPTDLKSAELVDVGAGQTDADYSGKDVAGKVVLASGSLSTIVEQAVWKRGALGIVHFTMSRSDLQDQIPWERIPVENADKTKQGTFAFVLSQRDGKRLRAELAASKAPYHVRARVESSFREPASQAIVEAVIRGTTIHDQAIVLTGHLQEERFSANDDGSGCANVLEIARALKRMIDDGRIARPERDIRFWWVNEISAEEQYFAGHPDERRKVLVNINQDMVGAKQSAGSRVQFVTRPPASRASFLGDVVQSVVEALVEGNTAYLAAVQARQVLRGADAGSGGGAATEDQSFSRPILSRLGTRERYDARVVPFHNNSDHQVFNMAPIGIPAVTFTNWPDDYIHSSDDDLWQIDPTQLKRNAVAVASSAWFVATAGSKDLPALAGQVVGRGLERIGHDTRRAVELAGEATGDVAARERAIALVGESVAREQRVVRSLAALSSDADSVVASALAQLPTPEAAMARVRSLLAPASSAPPPAAAEQEAGARVPSFVDDVAAFLDKRSKIKRPGRLHPLMAYEVLNFTDGVRSIADICRAVAAEADAAGSWYYGAVTLEDVTAYLDSAADAGVVTMGKKAVVAGKATAKPKGKGR
jgi:peptidase M28-like protein